MLTERPAADHAACMACWRYNRKKNLPTQLPSYTVQNIQYPTQVIIKLEESKGLNDRWTVSKLRQSFQLYITLYTNAQWYEVNTRSTHFSTSNKRYDKFNAFRPVKDCTDHISAEALVKNTDVPNQGKKIQESTRPCIYCKGNHFNDSCKQYTDVSTRKK